MVCKAIINFDHYKNGNNQLTFLGGKVVPNGKLHLTHAAQGADPCKCKPDIYD
jgi:hypothetical protein